MVLAEVSHRLPFYFAGALGVMAFVISVILIRQPQNTVESHHIHFETKELSKIQWGVFITPIILTFVLAFGLSSLRRYFLYILQRKQTTHLAIFQLLL